jgi:hypothetical protein
VFTGCHADLLIIVLHNLTVSDSEKLSALYSCFLAINLLQLFVSPKFLYAAESNHMYVSMLLESLNNIIQYQFDGNYNLVYTIIRKRNIFFNLLNLQTDQKTPMRRIAGAGPRQGAAAVRPQRRSPRQCWRSAALS